MRGLRRDSFGLRLPARQTPDSAAAHARALTRYPTNARTEFRPAESREGSTRVDRAHKRGRDPPPLEGVLKR